MNLYFIQWDISHFNQYLTSKLSKICPVESLSNWPVFFQYTSSIPSALTLWCSKRFQAFLKKVSLLYFSKEWSIETKTWVLGVFSAADGPLLLGPFIREPRKQICTGVCLHTYSHVSDISDTQTSISMYTCTYMCAHILHR